MACNDAKVVVHDSGTKLDGSNPNQTVADGIVAEITKVGGTAVSSFTSVTDFESSKGIIGTCVQNFSRTDILVNCAPPYVKNFLR